MTTQHTHELVPLPGMRAISWLLVTTSCLFVTAAVAADEPKLPAAAAEPEVVELTIHPAAGAEPALKYRLLPPAWERTPGNAAPLYYRAWLMQLGPPNDWPYKEIYAWEKMSPEKLPVKEVEKFIQSSVRLRQNMLRLAARREYCHWDFALRERENPFAVVLPEIDKAQGSVMALLLTAKLQIARGDYQEALDTLQISYQMMQDIGQGQFMIHKIYACTSAERFTHILEQLIGAKGTPNLYWAAKGLPDPFVDFRSAWQYELDNVYLAIPELQDARTAQLTADQWQQRWERAVARPLELTKYFGIAYDAPRTLTAGQLLAQRYPTARAGLLKFGFDQAKVEAMAKPQVVLVYEGEMLERAFNEQESLFSLPSDEASRRRSKLQAPEKDSLVHPFLNITREYEASKARPLLTRRLAGVCHIEAIRMYAAAHEGKLPAQLSDIKEVPLPLNPFTGQPFEYRLEGDVAVLTAPGTGEKLAPDLVYRLKLAM